MIHTVKGLGIVNKAEVDAFMEFSGFFEDPIDVGTLISDQPRQYIKKQKYYFADKGPSSKTVVFQ